MVEMVRDQARDEVRYLRKTKEIMVTDRIRWG